MERKTHKLSLLLHLLLFLLFIAALVLGNDTRLSLRPYIRLDSPLSWPKAQAYCRDNHTDLVTIRNAQDNYILLNIYKRQGWMGLYRDDSSSKWRWSRGAELANFTIWDGGEPGDRDCGVIYPNDLSWRAEQCSISHGFMCYHERLYLVKENKTWEEAMAYCRALMAIDSLKPTTVYGNNRFDLPSLTLADQIYAGVRAHNASTDEVWVGLRFLAGQWMWLETGVVAYQNLSQCSDQTFCGAIEKTGNTNLVPIDCMEKRNFFCYDKRNLPPP